MPKEPKRHRANRLGCFGIAIALALLIAALIAIGLNSMRNSELNADIPTLPSGR